MKTSLSFVVGNDDTFGGCRQSVEGRTPLSRERGMAGETAASLIFMHYRNGREAKNGDTVVSLGFDGARIAAVGVLHNAVPGNDYCNGSIAPISTQVVGACMCDCLHIDDITELLKEKGLDKRPAAK